MSIEDPQLATDAGTEHLRQMIAQLADRVDDLEEENRELRERLDSNPFEFRGDEESPKPEDVYVAGMPLGMALTSKVPKSDIQDLEERVEDLETRPGAKVDAEFTLPIQQVTDTWKSGAGSLTDNERRAAIVWSKFFDVCDKSGGLFTLSSSDVSTILAAKDESTHTETVRRTMEMVTDLGKEYVWLEKRRKKNHLVIDRDEWQDFVKELQSKSGWE